MIHRIPFGGTGHHSSRLIFGAAALGGMKQARADATLELLDQYGINHIDTAASYGESELRLAPFLATRRGDFFLASKTGERTYAKARDELHRSLERLGVEQLDLIQMHNLAQPDQWEVAMGSGGALEALVEARDAGLVKHIGVTGHGTYIAEMHANSLARFDFASVLLPYNPSMMANPQYAAEFEVLYATCRERGVAVQTIKSIARRRWRPEAAEKRFSWYEPIRDIDALRRAVHFVLAREGLFLNTTSDATLLETLFKLATEVCALGADLAASLDTAALAADQAALAVEPLFIRDETDDVRVAAE